MKRILIIASIILLTQATYVHKEVDYTNQGSDWDMDACQANNGEQSPVDISEQINQTDPDVIWNLNGDVTLNGLFDYEQMNKGYTICLHAAHEGSPFLTASLADIHGNQNQYEGWEIQFHTPSEHFIDGEQLDLEMHILMKNQGTVVNNRTLGFLAFLFKEDPSAPDLPILTKVNSFIREQRRLLRTKEEFLRNLESSNETQEEDPTETTEQDAQPEDDEEYEEEEYEEEDEEEEYEEHEHDDEYHDEEDEYDEEEYEEEEEEEEEEYHHHFPQLSMCLHHDFFEHLPGRVQAWHYEGGMTYPGCYEIVNWYVNKDFVRVNSEQLAKFKKLWVNAEFNGNHLNGRAQGNNRELQDLGDRNIHSGSYKVTKVPGQKDFLSPICLVIFVIVIWLLVCCAAYYMKKLSTKRNEKYQVVI